MTDITMIGARLWLTEAASRLRWRVRWSTRSKDIERRESLRLTEMQPVDVAVLPGEAATVDALSRDRARDSLVKLVQQFADDGLTWTAGSAARLSPETTKAATAFLQALPAGIALPRISPDGDGGLTMAWEDRGNLVLAVLDDWRFHLVSAATTPRAKYVDDLPFDGEQIPKAILEAIPAR